MPLNVAPAAVVVVVASASWLKAANPWPSLEL